MKWTDTTSYISDGLKPAKDGKLSPIFWSAQLGEFLRVVVFKHRGQWYMSLPPLFADRPLDLPDVAPADVAQERAIFVVRDVLADVVRSF